jgi:hypothetical protein
MPYLPVDLDGKRKAEEIERALGLPRLSIVGGLVDLWEAVWRAKSSGSAPEVAAVVDDLAIGSAFGQDTRIRPALVARGFLEPVEKGWRVRGAAKWLFGLEGKKRGGQASKGNLKQGSKAGGSAGSIAGDPKPPSPAMPGPMPGGIPEDRSRLDPRLLHPATQHPAPKLLPLEVVAASPPTSEAMEFFVWTQDAAEVAQPGRFPEAPPPEWNEFYPRAVRTVGSPERLAGTWLGWVKDPWAASRKPTFSVRAFIARDKWKDFIPPEVRS